MSKKNLFKGLIASCGSVLCICAFMTSLAWNRVADINTFFGITGKGDGKGSAYKSLEEKDEAEKDYMIRTEEEGSVLLRNNNDALPLTSGAKVTLFGNASVKTNYHGGSGGPSNSGYSLHDALIDEGFSINETVYAATEKVAAKPVDHDIKEVDAAIYNEADFSGYKDAAIVVISRFSGEANDYDVEDSYGVPELSLHDSEKAILEKVKNGGFSKIVVLLNTGTAMDIGWLSDYNVDACMWIAYPGTNGMRGVAKMIKGEVSPSGNLVDTYATNSLSSPAMQNFGNFTFTDLPDSMYHCEYVIYAEDIYTGYKYYETRYADAVQNKNNAKSSVGTFCGETSWDYGSEIVYPFGYGLSYTTFEEKLNSVSWDHEKHEITANVTVKNTGKVDGKDAVQLYASLPYESGMAQKSAIQLAGYNKTGTIKAGESETMDIVVNDYLIATYDENATNGADTNKKGCYVFDKGDYYFSIGDSVHDALNNVLAKQGISGLTDQDGNSVTGDQNKVFKETIATTDNTSYAKSPHTGEVVSNQFDQVNYNYYEKDEITYLTRDNWETFPKSYTGLSTEKDSSGVMKKHMTAKASLYETPSDAPSYKDFKHDQEVTLKFIDMQNVAYDDEKWETFVDQLAVADLAAVYGEKMAHDAFENVQCPANTAGDGPDGLQNTSNSLHPSETLAAATYNLDLLEERGKFLAEDAMYNGFSSVYGGGANFHRTPYGGRNFEYYSEESVVAYLSGRRQAQAMANGGLISMFKHFCGNDQETNRHGVATFMTEQALRQNQAKSFEGALASGAGMGNMSAYNRLGVIPTASYKALMTTLLRNEWGSTGLSITDSSKDASSYIFTADAVDAGTDMFNNDADRATEVKNLLIKTKDGNIWKKARATAKNYFYNFVHSNVTYSMTEGETVTTETPWWQTAVIALDSTLAVLTVGSMVMFVIFAYVKKEEK